MPGTAFIAEQPRPLYPSPHLLVELRISGQTANSEADSCSTRRRCCGQQVLQCRPALPGGQASLHLTINATRIMWIYGLFAAAMNFTGSQLLLTSCVQGGQYQA